MIALLPLFAVLPASAAIVAPHALFLTHESRTAVFYVHNPGHKPLEVDVELQFGYPMSDADGVVRVALFPDPGPDEPSAAEWIKALPRRMVVPPGKRQAVRLLARPTAALPDGEYWSRILVTSREQQDVQEVAGSPGVQVGLTLATRTITSLMYRKGELATDVYLRDLKVENGVVSVDMERLGNAAYLGRLEVTLHDAEGSELWRFDRSVAVYYELLRKIQLPLADLPAGDYEIRARLSNDRKDLDPSLLIHAPAQEQRIALHWAPELSR